MEISMYGRTDFVRPYRTKKNVTEKRQTNKQKTHRNLPGNTSEGLNILGTLNVTDNNLMEISMYGRTDFVRPYETKKIFTNKHRQTHRKPWGIHLKELKLNVRPMAQSDGNLNVRTDGPSVRTEQKNVTNKHKHTRKKTLGVASEGIEISIRFTSILIHQIYFHQIYIKRDRWHNLMEISMYRRTELRRTNTNKQTNTKNLAGCNTSEG
jgi:hypothetical protein